VEHLAVVVVDLVPVTAAGPVGEVPFVLSGEQVDHFLLLM
jgi:hypothetical protein